MKLNAFIFISILFAHTVSSAAWGDCGYLLGAEPPATLPVGTRIEKVWKLGRQLVPYTAIGAERNRRGFYSADDILPVEAQDRGLIIGIQGEHPYIWYKGYRLDTDGEAGFKVITKMTKSQFLYGDAMIVLRDLPPETILNFDRVLEGYQRKSFISCARAACSYLNTADSSILNNRNFRTTSSVIKALVAEKMRGRSVDIYVMGNHDMKDVYKNITDTEFSVQTNLFVGGMVASTLPLTILAALIQLMPI